MAEPADAGPAPAEASEAAAAALAAPVPPAEHSTGGVDPAAAGLSSAAMADGLASKDDQIAQLKRANGTLRRQLQEFSEALDAALQQKRRPRSRDAALLTAQLTQAEKKNRTLQKEVVALTSKLEAADVAQLNALEAALFARTARVAELESALKAQQRVQRDLEKDLTKIGSEDMHKQLRIAVEDAAAMRKQNRALQQQHAADLRLVKQKSDEHEDMAARVKRLEATVRASADGGAGGAAGGAGAGGAGGYGPLGPAGEVERLKGELAARDARLAEQDKAVKVLTKTNETLTKRLRQVMREQAADAAAAKVSGEEKDRTIADKERELRVAQSRLREAAAAAAAAKPALLSEEAAVLQRLVGELEYQLGEKDREVKQLLARRAVTVPRLGPPGAVLVAGGGALGGAGAAKSAPHSQRVPAALRPGGPRRMTAGGGPGAEGKMERLDGSGPNARPAAINFSSLLSTGLMDPPTPTTAALPAEPPARAAAAAAAAAGGEDDVEEEEDIRDAGPPPGDSSSRHPAAGPDEVAEEGAAEPPADAALAEDRPPTAAEQADEVQLDSSLADDSEPHEAAAARPAGAPAGEAAGASPVGDGDGAEGEADGDEGEGTSAAATPDPASAAATPEPGGEGEGGGAPVKKKKSKKPTKVSSRGKTAAA